MIKNVDHYALTYQTYGSGPEVLLAFHGYGQDHRVFEKFAAAQNNRYTVYSFDLLLHGENPGFSSDQTITVAAWQSSVYKFLEGRNVTNFSLVGYSLGARFALTLVPAMAPQINELILIAPDGIKSSRWYQLASGTWLGNNLLRYTVVRPRPFLWTLRKTHQLKLIEKSVLKFVEVHMNTRSERLKVYQRWGAFRRVQPDLRRVKEECNTHQIKITIFLGEYDAVVKRAAITNFHKALDNSNLHILPCGHAALVDKVSEHYAARH